MKKILISLICCSLVLVGCFPSHSVFAEELSFQEDEPSYNDLSDPNLLAYVEGKVYEQLVDSLDSDQYYVGKVSAIYIPQEYIDEVTYNSQSNIYFGYTLAELEEAFGNTKYVFTLGEDGKTTVVPFEDYDDTYDRVIRNIAVGTGVIMVCVTVSIVTAGTGAAAISVIFAESAKTGTIMALSSGTMGAVSAGLVTGIQTGDMNEALKAAALAGSEGYMMGAITGAISGGTSAAIDLKNCTLNGLTMNQAAMIQRESGYPIDVISQFKSMDQYEICKEAGLTAEMVDGKLALIRDIDLTYKGETGLTNLERMKSGLPALDPLTGDPYELHHIGQEMDSTLAILTEEEHRSKGIYNIWHSLESESKIDRIKFAKQRSEFWKAMAKGLIEK